MRVTNETALEPPAWVDRHPTAVRRALRGLAAIALALAAYLFFLSPEGYLARRDIARRIDLELSRRAEISGEIGRVEDQVSALSGDPEAVERLARDELGYERPGESTLDPNL